MERVVEEYRRVWQTLLPVILGDVAVDLVKKGLEYVPGTPVKGPFAKMVAGAILPIVASLVRDPRVKTALTIGGALGLWQGFKEFLKGLGVYKLESAGSALKLEITPEIIYVPPEKKEEEKIEVLEVAPQIEVV
jgi:hypothetical protein